MKTFLALVSKQETLNPDLLACVPSLAARALPFRNMPHRGGSVGVALWPACHLRLG